MRPGPNSSKFVVALITAVALVATACGGGAETPTQIVNSEGLASTGWGAPAEPETDEAATPDVDDSDPGRAFGSPAGSGEASPTNSGDVSPTVLAYAIENSTGVSYSFEQGLSINMAVDGYIIRINPDAPIASGEVDGTASYVEINLAPFMEDTFLALGFDPNQPKFAELLDIFIAADFNIWTEGDVVTLDMADYVAAAETMTPGSMSGLPELGSGPVSIDLAKLENIDPWMLGAAVGNTQIIDPSSLIESLRDVGSVSEVGTDSVAGRAVTVYAGSVTMADYYAAIGQDLDTQLAEFDSLLPESLSTIGLDSETLRELMVGIDVSITAMIDEQNLLRRIEFVLDMGEMMGAITGGSASVRMNIGVWQEFDEYGKSFNIEAPDAVDITSSFDSLFGPLVTVPSLL